MKLSNQKFYITPICIAIIQFLLCNIFNISRFYFDSPININYVYYFKALHLIFLIITWVFIFFVYKKYKENDILFKRGVKLFSILFGISTIALLLVYPAIYDIDDSFLLLNHTTYQIDTWHHALTSIWHIIALQSLPFPSGIIIQQNFIASICAAFTIVKLENSFNLYLKNKYLDIILKILPFISFPILRYQLCCQRMGIYIFVELAMLTICVCGIKEKNWSIKYCLFFAIISALATTWRSECIIYLPIIFIIIFFSKNINTFYKRLFSLIVLILSFLLITHVQNVNSNGCQLDYYAISIMRQTVELTKVAKNENDIESLKIINKIFYVDNILKGNTYKFDSIKREIKNKNDFYLFLKRFFVLSAKYPKVVLKERLDIFRSTNIVWQNSNLILTNIDNIDVFNPENKINFIKEVKNRHFLLNKPINRNIQKNTISLITMIDSNNSFYKTIYKFVWKFTLPLVVLILFSIFSLFKYKNIHSLIFLGIILKTIIIFLTAPMPFFMYYLSQYVSGYIIFFYVIIYIISHFRTKING